MDLDKQVAQLEAYIDVAETGDAAISKQSVGWHVHHSLKVIHSILKAMSGSSKDGYKWTFNFNRIVFLEGLGWFPRGIAKAPRLVRPPEQVDVGLIHEELAAVRAIMPTLDGLPRNSHFTHPYFGVLNKPAAIRFMNVHTRHHLKIIRDIVKA